MEETNSTASFGIGTDMSPEEALRGHDREDHLARFRSRYGSKSAKKNAATDLEEIAIEYDPDEDFKRWMELSPEEAPPLDLGSELPDIDEPEVYLHERWATAAREMGATHQAIQALVMEPKFKPEPGFSVLDYPELGKNLSADGYDRLVLDSHSLPEAIMHQEKLEHEEAEMKKVFKDGVMPGIVALLGGTLADPASLMAFIGEAKVLQAIASQPLGTRAAVGAATTGAVVGAETGLAAFNQESVTLKDVALGLAIGAGLGGFAGAITRGTADEFHAAASTIEQRQLDEFLTALDEIDPAYRGSLVHDPALNPARSIFGEGHEARGGAAPLKAADVPAEEAVPGKITVTEGDDAPLTHRMNIKLKVDENYGLDEETIIKHLGEQGAKSGTNKALLAEALRRMADGSVPTAEVFKKTALGKFMAKQPLHSDALAMFTSESPIVRMYANEFLEDASRMAGSQNHTASIMTRKFSQLILDDWVPTFEREFKMLRKERGGNIVDEVWSGKMDDEIMLELRHELEARSVAHDMNVKHVSEAHPRVQTIADAMDAGSKRSLDLAKKYGVAGADEITHRPGFVPLVFRGRALIKAQAAGKIKAVKNLLAKSYVQMGIDEDIAQKISNAVITRSMTTAGQLDTNPMRILSKDSRGFLEKILQESNVQRQDIDSIFRRIDTDVDDKGVSKRMRSRVSVDLRLEEDGVRLLDFVDNDIPTLMARFSQEQAGRAAMAAKGLNSDTRVQNMRQAVIESSQMVDSEAHTNRIRKSFDAVQQEFLAQPVGGGVNRFVRRLIESTANSRLGQVVFAQAAETNNVIALNGFSQAIKASPIVAKMHKALKNMAKGKAYDKDAVRFFEDMRPFTGRLYDQQTLFRVGVHLDESLSADPEWIAGAMRKFDRLNASASDRMGYAGGMYKVMTMQQQAGIFGMTQKVVDGLTGVKPFTAADRARLLDAGWGAKELNQLRKVMKHVDYQKGGSWVDSLNMEKWDPVTQEVFASGIQRHVNQVVQFGMIGENRYWQHTTIGRLLTQFKTFSITAMEKQFARNIKHGLDPHTMAVVGYGSMLSAAVVLAKTHANTIGMTEEQRAEYLAPRITPEALASSAVLYNGFWGVGAEAAGLGYTLGLSPIPVGSARGGGAGISKAEGYMPAIQWGFQAVNAVTQLDPNAASKAAAFGNHLGVSIARNAVNSILE